MRVDPILRLIAEEGAVETADFLMNFAIKLLDHQLQGIGASRGFTGTGQADIKGASLLNERDDEK
jgi:hypothetical protein